MVKQEENIKEILKIFSEENKKFNNILTKQNREMVSYTKTMKWLTWVILGFTIANFVSLLIQINLNEKFSKEQIALTGNLILHVNKTIEQGEVMIDKTGVLIEQNTEKKIGSLPETKFNSNFGIMSMVIFVIVLIILIFIIFLREKKR